MRRLGPDLPALPVVSPASWKSITVTEDLVRVELTRVVLNEKSEQQFIQLKEVDGSRSFPIVIGFNEAVEINRKLASIPMQRPLTHDLIGRILATLEWRLASVAISDLKEGTFFAILVLEQSTADGVSRKTVDCRPSDAIALAVQVHAPIYVDRTVLDQVALG